MPPLAPKPPLNPADFTVRFDAAAHRAGFGSERLGEVEGHQVTAYTKRTAGPRPRVYLSAGIHGDEPAPPLALLRLMEEGYFDGRCTWFICPLLNPTGMLRGNRHNFQDIDLNRDYKDGRATEVRVHIAWLQRQPNFDLAVCLREDWEAKGFYLYELNPDHRPTLANAMISAARAEGPIEPATVIDDREVTEPGIIRPAGDPLLRENWPEAIYLHFHHGTFGYTIETSSSQPLEQRIATHCAVLKAAIGEFLSRTHSVEPRMNTKRPSFAKPTDGWHE
jgi:hypothetical protein